MKSILIGLILLAAQLAFSGGESSGGGPGVFCNQGILLASVQLLDTYEAKYIFGRDITSSNTSVQSQLQTAVAKLASVHPILAAKLRKELRTISKNYSMLPTGFFFPDQPSDLGTSWQIPLRENCRLAYIGYYPALGRLSVASSAYDLLSSNTERAGFFLHEALYKVYRQRHSPQNWNSEKTRMMVGVLLDQTSTIRQIESLLNEFDFSLNHYLTLDHRGGIFNLSVTLEPEQNSSMILKILCHLGNSNFVSEYKWFEDKPEGVSGSISIQEKNCVSIGIHVGTYVNGTSKKVDVRQLNFTYDGRSIPMKPSYNLYPDYFIFDRADLIDQTIPDFPGK